MLAIVVSSDVGDVSLGPEYSDELVLVVVDVALHDLHARAEQTLERVHVQNWNRETDIPDRRRCYFLTTTKWIKRTAQLIHLSISNVDTPSVLFAKIGPS